MDSIMSRKMVRWSRSILLISCLMLCGGQASLAAVGARLDRSQVSMDETVTLVLQDTGGERGVEPDLSGLQPYFDILGTSSSSNLSIVNGRSSSSRQWQITLQPKQKGDIVIPGIAIGSQRSEPLMLKVTQADYATADGTPPLFFQVEVDNPNPYVQARVMLTIRFYYRVQANGQLLDPEAENATLVRAGKDASYMAEHNGQRYKVVERHLAVFPQASGSLEIPGPLFDGEVPDETRNRRFGGLGSMFLSSRKVRKRGPPVLLKVRPRPDSFKGSHWLPAADLQLSEDWSADLSSLSAGEPVTRSITLTARGVLDIQLPELQFEEGKGYRVYPDQPVVKSQWDGSDLVTTGVYRVAIVPSQAGTLELPELRLPWWDLQADQQREASLPAETLQVHESANMTASRPPPAQPVAAPGTPQPEPAPAMNTVDAPVQAGKNFDWLPVTLVVTLLWLVTVLLWFLDRRKRGSTSPARPVAAALPKADDSKALRGLKQACEQGDAAAARNSLLTWARHRWTGQSINSLGAIVQRLHDPVLAERIQVLDRSLYEKAAPAWQDRELWQLVQQLPAARQRHDRQPPLPALYPQQDHG